MLRGGIAQFSGYFGGRLTGVAQVLVGQLQPLIGEVAENSIVEFFLKPTLQFVFVEPYCPGNLCQAGRGVQSGIEQVAYCDDFFGVLLVFQVDGLSLIGSGAGFGRQYQQFQAFGQQEKPLEIAGVFAEPDLGYDLLHLGVEGAPGLGKNNRLTGSYLICEAFELIAGMLGKAQEFLPRELNAKDLQFQRFVFHHHIKGVGVHEVVMTAYQVIGLAQLLITEKVISPQAEMQSYHIVVTVRRRGEQLPEG